MCYTNHALDQFLEDFLDFGIDPSGIVRLGSKGSARTKPLQLSEQRFRSGKRPTSWATYYSVEKEVLDAKDSLEEAFKSFQNQSNDAASVLGHLEFEDLEFYEAFEVPIEEEESAWTTVDQRGHAVKPDYLIERWMKGENPGIFTAMIAHRGLWRIWTMNAEQRYNKSMDWFRAIATEKASSVASCAAHYNDRLSELENLRAEKDREILKSKRIIGCTTTAAAMYSENLKSVRPGIVILEEAGEILESHVLTALRPETKQLILIGDHQQLRPKINSYELTVEKNEGYDLNMSMFERLICAGFPHTTLLKQHRMCPEISALVRKLTYSDLNDDDKTKNRPQPRGLQDRVIFIQHDHPEDNFADISDRRDEGAKQSKTNSHEAQLILSVVKYLAQQGYGTADIVVLTPYLGQLHLLRNMLSKQNDPVLNDLDSHDLVKAGLLSRAGADHSKRLIKLSTIG